MYFNNSDSGNFTNSISEYSQYYGVYVYSCSPTFRGNRIENNTSYGIYIVGTPVPDLGASDADKGRNTILDNDSGGTPFPLQVYNASSSTINAYNNYWVYTTAPEIDAHISDDNEGSGGEVFFTPWLTGDESLPVVLSAFAATTEGDNVKLIWRTETEMNNLGFDVYRSDAKDGKYTKINAKRIQGAGTDATPHEYSFTDENVVFGKTYYYYIEDIDFAGNTNKSHIIKVTVGQQSIKTYPIPLRFALLQNFPNPFNPDTWVPYELAADAPVFIRIYDVKGQLVRQLELGKQEAGSYLDKEKAAYWDGKDQFGQTVSSGIYFYTLRAGAFQATRKMVILK